MIIKTVELLKFTTPDITGKLDDISKFKSEIPKDLDGISKFTPSIPDISKFKNYLDFSGKK
jgi:hypothetical protein